MVSRPELGSDSSFGSGRESGRDTTKSKCMTIVQDLYGRDYFFESGYRVLYNCGLMLTLAMDSCDHMPTL